MDNNTDDESFKADDFLWDFIDSYITIMAPLQKTIVQFQEEQLHYGNSIIFLNTHKKERL